MYLEFVSATFPDLLEVAKATKHNKLNSKNNKHKSHPQKQTQ